MSVKRVKVGDPNAIVIQLMYREAIKHPLDGQWRLYDKVIECNGKKYHISAEFVFRDAFLSHRNLQIKKIDRDQLIIQ